MSESIKVGDTVAVEAFGRVKELRTVTRITQRYITTSDGVQWVRRTMLCKGDLYRSIRSTTESEVEAFRAHERLDSVRLRGHRALDRVRVEHVEALNSIVEELEGLVKP